MPEYLAPGVYVEETSFRSKSIEGVSTTTTGFIGPARLDVGVRVPCAQVLGTCEELSEAEGGPPRLLGLPVYIAIAIGEAF